MPFCATPICSKRLSQLRTGDFAAYRDERLRHIKPASLKRSLVPVRHLFEVARHEWGLPLRDNPLDRLGLKAAEQRRERRLRPGELTRLLAAARTARNPHIGPIIRLAVATGMRRSELLAIRSEHVDLDARILLIPDSKSGKARHIPLSLEAIDVLRSLEATNGRFFPMTGNGFRLAWERLRRRAGIEGLHFHDLRHEAISRFFEMGLSVPEVALISGHRDVRMLFRYAHPVRQGILAKMNATRPDQDIGHGQATNRRQV
jgi:integrase